MTLFFDWISNRNNITFLIAVVGFALSIFNFIESRLYNRKNLDFSITNTLFVDMDKNLLFTLSLVNKSRLPITIVRGEMEFPNGSICQFGEISSLVFQYSNPTLSGKKTEHTQKFPIELSSYGAKSVFMKPTEWASEYGTDIPSQCTITLFTSRGKITKTVKMPIPVNDWKQLLSRIR